MDLAAIPGGRAGVAGIAGAIVLLLVLAGAAVASRGGGDGDDPTAVASTSPAATVDPDAPAVGASTAPSVPAAPTEPASGAPAPLATADADPVLAVGTCLIDISRPEDVTSVTPIGCGEEHAGEVFSSAVLDAAPDAAYPGFDELRASTQTLCRGEPFATYIGIPYAESAVLAYALVPTQETWAVGDRDVACYLAPLTTVTGSLQGSEG